MAAPLRYQSQYVPTNFSAVGNLTNLLARDMASRDQLYDSAVAAESMAYENIGAMPVESVSLQERNNRLNQLQGKINDIVNKYGKDYGAAARDISRTIALERSNPFYEFARTQNEQAKSYRDLKQKLGANFYAQGDPTKVTYNDWQQNPNALDFKSANIEDIVKQGIMIGQGISQEHGNLINREIEGLMREVGYDYGKASTIVAQKYLQENPKIVQGILDSYGINDPMVAQRVTQAMIPAMIGKRDTRFVQDYGKYLDYRRRDEEQTVPATITGVLNERLGSSLAPLSKAEISKNSEATTDVNALYGQKIRQNIISDNPDLSNKLTSAGIDITKDVDINTLNNRISELTSLQQGDMAHPVNATEWNRLDKQIKTLQEAKVAFKSDIASYYDDKTGDYELATYGYDKSLRGAMNSGMEPAKYFKYIDDAEKAMNDTLSKYTIGNDFKIEAGDYTEKDLRKLREKVKNGKSLSSKEEYLQGLMKDKGLRFISALGNSYTGIKFLVKDSSGTELIISPKSPTVFNNLMANLDRPELQYMEQYKDQVRSLIPGSKVGKSSWNYGETRTVNKNGIASSKSYLYKDVNGYKKPLTNGDYLTYINSLRIPEDSKAKLAYDLQLHMLQTGEDTNSMYSPTEGNEYKLVQLSQLIK